MAKRFFRKNCEPTLAELLQDPIACLLMARDGVQVADVVELAENAKAILRLRDE
jgi:hypothetical protein